MEADEQVVVFRTGILWEYDAIASALKDAGIPYFSCEETSSGLRLAMPAAPSGAPGTWWTVRVPFVALEDAKAVLAQFPFGDKVNPGVYDFTPFLNVKIVWKIAKICGIVVLVLIIVSFLSVFFNWITRVR